MIVFFIGVVILLVGLMRMLSRGSFSVDAMVAPAVGLALMAMAVIGHYGEAILHRIRDGKERTMSGLRMFAVVLIFAGVSVAWLILGGTVTYRTETLDHKLAGEIQGLWGPSVVTQAAPYIAPKPDSARPGMAAPAASDIKVEIRHQHRDKGLLWYSTYQADMEARYTLPAAGEGAKEFFIFPLPAGVTKYPRLEVTMDDKPIAVREANIANGKIALPLPEGVQHVVVVRYSVNGQDIWMYSPGDAPAVSSSRDNDRSIDPVGPVVRLNNFSLTVSTDFADIDYPKGTASPNTPAEAAGAGRRAAWVLDNAWTNQPMGIAMPHRLNAGPIAARMSFFAPVSLLLFFTVLFAVVVLKGLRLHPMHYLFIAAGFFAFHILLAYLVDLVNIHVAFWISSAVSVLLVVSYMRLVAGVKFAVVYCGLAQLVYLVGFAYAFFWEGRTGLTVTIGAILTLFVLMQATGRVKWHEVFSRTIARPAIAPPSSAAPC